MIWTAFLLGFMGSFHCVGMCGPIAMAIGSSGGRKFMAKKVLYHLGRSLTYSILGLLVGSIGFTFSLAGIQQGFSVAIGVFIIFMALAIKNSETWTSATFFSKPVQWIKSQLSFFLKKGSGFAFFSTGFVNGLLPCGMVYLALVAALGMQSPWEGAAYMFFFGVGTVPLLLILMFSGSMIPQRSRLLIQKSIPYIGIIVGLIFIIRGLGLGWHGLSPDLHVFNYGAEQIEITLCR